MEKKKKLKKFKLFDMNRDGKGVDPGEDRTPNLKFFFKQLWRKLSKILSLNLIMIFQVIPIIASVLLLLFATPTTPTYSHSAFPVLYGMNYASSNAVTQSGVNVFSYQLGIHEYGTSMYLIVAIIMGVLVITYGWQKVGSIYVTRGLVRGDSVFVMSDFFYGIKKNWKQGLGFGLLDCLFMFLLGYDFIYLYNSAPNGFTNFMYVLTFALIIMYIIMRFYIYLMLVTFNIKIFKAIKNSFIFMILGIKRNLMACLGLIIVSAIAIVPCLLFLPKYGVFLILPLLYYLGICAFIYTYAAYPVIEKYMIAPVNTDEQ